MEDVLQYIDEHADEFVARVQALCRQPSIAAQDIGMGETAALVRGVLREIGADARLVPTCGYPVVFGQIAGPPASKTLGFYNHYDVQPPEPLELWDSDPFAAEIRDGRIYARGVADNKANLVSRICAVKAYQKVRGALPLGVKFIVEGEEEIGSVNLKAFAHGNKALIACDGLIWESGYKNRSEQLSISLGVKGILYVELRVRGANTDAHSAAAAIIPSPVWRLIWALNSLKGPDEQVLIPGFYDDVRPPTPAEVELLEKLPLDEEAWKTSIGVDDFVLSLTGMALKEKYLFQPTCNVCGFEAGYTGQGLKTVLPNAAMCKIDFRLVPDQDPHAILDNLRGYLNERDFDDIEIKVWDADWAHRTDPDDPLVGAVVAAAERVYDRPPVVVPTSAGSGPRYTLCGELGIPSAGAGTGYYDSKGHAPNENIRIADFIEGVKHIAVLLEEFARA
ncbi:MAG: M20/M25/M40 family metallo-hydrolase [Anaerolineae bacterium]|nr:MAG: M20/M25/M40 family metallo-hydrolase [Anaerolineae bacterium]